MHIQIQYLFLFVEFINFLWPNFLPSCFQTVYTKKMYDYLIHFFVYTVWKQLGKKLGQRKCQ